MNTQRYRIIFNKTRGQLMAVAESAAGDGKSAGTTAGGCAIGPALWAVLRGASVGVLLAFGLAAVLPEAHAQIVAYKAAPASQQATVLSAGNGVPLVNIQTPSAAGVSRNTYSQFDVQAAGAIINNSRTNTQTQLGGWVQGNPWLATGTARVILNEVIATNPSQLLGYLEVAGSRAQIVIANPAGVTCSGCGFINANRVTLTTGTPIITGGQLDGYRVERGTISIEGAGMDASQVGYTELLARSVDVNAGLWAQTLKVTAGANQINAEHSQATPIAGQGAAPAFAIDVAQLGGMYANKITLVGTEAGVGVKNAGQIGASAGDVVITADGQLINSGTLAASGGIALSTTDTLENRGLVSAGQTLTIQADTVDNAATRTAGLGLEGSAVNLTANHVDNHNGAVRANTALNVNSSGTLDNSNGLISSAQNLALRDSRSSRTLAITNTGGTLIAGQRLDIDAASLGGDGTLLSQGDLAIVLTSDYTHTGRLAANGRAELTTSGDLINHGTLEAGTALTLSAATLDNQATGKIAAPELSLKATAAHTLTNRGLIDGTDTRIDTVTLNNLGTGHIYGDHLSIAATTLNNDAETIGSVTRTPVIAARDRLDLGVGTVNNRNGAVLFSTGDIAIGGALDSNWLATGQAVAVNNHAATIESLGQLALSAADIRNTNAGLVTDIVVESTQHIQEVQPEGWAHRYDVSFFPNIFNHNIEGQTYVVNGVVKGGFEDYTFYDYTGTTKATRVVSTLPGQILAGSHLTLAGNLENTDSRIVAGGTLTHTGGTLSNTSTQGTRTTTYSGWAQFRDWDGDDEELEFGGIYAFSPAPIVTSFNLGIARYETNTAPSGTGTTVASLAVGGLGQSASGRNGLFSPNPDPDGDYVIETDARFAGYRQWLGSDYMQSQLALDPAATQKRLGDGFYEQRLINEQVAQLTGRRFLEGYASDEAQYRALMDAGVAVAKGLNLRLGVALTAEQMAQLTTDIVWLIEKDVPLADGRTQKVLAPQVYVRVQDGDLSPSSALLAGENLLINLSGDLHNQGTLAGRKLVTITAENLQNLGGRITGNAVGLLARNDLTNRGGQIDAGDTLVALAGHDLTVESTTRDTENNEGSARFTRTAIDRLAGLYVKNAGGTLKLAADGNIALNAAQLQSAGTTRIEADGTLSLGTARIAEENNTGLNAANLNRSGATAEIGSTLDSAGAITLVAKGDLTARAASVTSSTGVLTVSAGHDLLIEAGEATSHSEITQKKKRSGTFSSTTKIQRDAFADSTAQASTFSGDTVKLEAGNDIQIKGSNVVGTGEVKITAGHDLAIESVTETHEETHYKKTTQSGLFSSGGFGVTLGSRMLSTDQQSQGTTAAASTVGSTNGNVVMQAGNAYHQVGSDVVATAGDIDVTAKTVAILESRETNRSTYETRTKQSGLTIAITSPIISAIQTAQQMSEAASETKDSRMQLLAAANTGLSAYSTYNAIQAGQGTTMQQPDGSFKDNQIDTGKVDANGNAISRDATAGERIGGINLSVSLGSSSSQSLTTQTSDTAAGSTLKAGRNLTITATGAGQDSDIIIQGTDLAAGKNLTLKADDEIALLAAANSADQHSTNTSSSASIGFSIGTDGLLFNIGASAGRGNADGADLYWTNSHVTAGETLTLQSGGDTTLKGAVAQGNQVIANVGGDLKLESLQDQSTYDSEQKNAGFSLSIGAGRVSGSLSYSQSDIESDYASVTEQTGIKAGDAGFQIKVTGDTALKGAVIASSQSALDAGKNEFQTGGTLTTSDIHNHAEYEAESTSVNIGTSVSFSGALKPGGTSAGFGKDSDAADSTTQSGITGLAGNTSVRTGDPETGIARIFDQEKVQKEIEAQTKITQLFGQQAPKAAADFAASQAADLRKQGNEDEARKWDEGGIYRIALHTTIGGLAGGMDGALGAGAVATAAPLLNDLQTSIVQGLKDAGVNDTVAQLAGQVVSSGTAAAIGSAVSGGSTAGTSMAFNVDANNRQLHESEVQWLKKKAKEFAQKEGISEEKALERLTQQALKEVDFLWRAQLIDGDDANAKTFLASTQESFTNDHGDQQRLFTTSEQQLFRPEMFAETADPSFYKQFAQSGISRKLNDGLVKEIKDSGISLKDGAIELAKLAKENPEVVLGAVWNAVKNLPQSVVDGFKETGDAIGEGAAVSLDKELSDKLNAIYGTDVSSIQKALLAIRITTAISGAGGVAKAATHVTEATAKAVAKKLDEILDVKTLETLVKSGGVLENGTPLLDLKALTTDQKRVIGELLGENTVKQIVPEGKKLASLQGVGTNGIDDLYKVNRADVDYVVIEYKFVGADSKTGASVLGNTADGPQASEKWTLGSGRLEKAVGEKSASDVEIAIRSGRVETWVVTTRPEGSTIVEVLDALGKPKAVNTSSILKSLGNLVGAQP